MRDLSEVLVDAAMSWWHGKKPVDWGRNAHIRNPTINCTTEREKKLAKVCGMIAELKQQKAADRRREGKSKFIRGLHV